MTKTSSILVLTTLTLAIASLACDRTEPQEQPPAAAPPDAATATATSTLVSPEGTDVPSSETPDAAEEVAYEPAYPDDVSAEELTEGDVAQQEAGHSHDDGEEHTHDGDETHDHQEPDH